MAVPFPVVDRPDAPTVLVASLDVTDERVQRMVAEQLCIDWQCEPWPADVVSLNCFLSTDGANVLAYIQCTSERPSADLPGLRTLGAEPIAYRVYRSLTTPEETRVPGCLVTALFTVDGPERQRRFVDSLIAALPEDDGHPGAISAHFHLSLDGGWMLNYTEWTSQEAHGEAAASGAHDDLHDLFANTPGVQPLGGKRYHLHRILTAPVG
ncbi:antibiotic biosynthesis monooxygenase family protein [Amycolatopsis anabasis]|uniref:antibiotic biosynthesis monooxygenase family protein n=1 Tax=Amycolatopsis anabasis TaxID=1840409 RepID=UPI00131EB41B|nr:antibiotic biosynthesis monooxygenase [Amycolatopsis anabasis]